MLPPLTTKQNKQKPLCEVIDVLTNFIMVIISQYIHISNHCVI